MKWLYYGVTGLVSLAMLGGGIGNLTSPDMATQLGHLGYPLWFGKLLGTWYVLGAVAIVAPGLPRLKEWAYAGFFFALSSAVVSHLAAGDGAAHAAPAAMLLLLAMTSWATRPANRRLGPSLFGGTQV